MSFLFRTLRRALLFARLTQFQTSAFYAKYQMTSMAGGIWDIESGSNTYRMYITQIQFYHS